jgi:FemAB-related protein (PEP-CTERM system-associated)
MEIAVAQDKDIERWDRYVSQQPQASPYHYYAWKLAAETAYRQKSCYLMALDAQQQVCGILPVIFIKRPFAQASLCSLPYCDRGEALADSESIAESLVAHANQLRQSMEAAAYEYRASMPFNRDLDTDHILPGSKVRMLLPLPDSSADLLAGFKAKLRSQIKKAEKNGLSFKTGNNDTLLADFYQVFTVNMKDLGSPVHSLDWFKAIARHYADRCVISVVRYNDIPVGAGLILRHTETAAIPWASTLRSYNKLAPNMLLYWSLLEYATDHGNHFFDFGRSTIGEGTFKFKQQWGAIPVPLDWTTFPEMESEATQPVVASKSSLRETAENIWKRLPLPLTVLIGSRVRKYISL